MIGDPQRWSSALLVAAGSLLLLGQAPVSFAAESGSHAHHAMTVDANGAVMNENHDTLPRGCERISGDLDITVRAGSERATEPGMLFAMEPATVQVAPCSRVRVTFVNEDQVRHQWMVHGLPKYLYPTGMFHIEANGGTTREGTFIAPAGNRTYLVHCDIAQHMERGMRGQLVVGRGSGDLWSIPGHTDAFIRDPYLPPGPRTLGWAAAAAIVGALLIAFANRSLRL